VLHFLDEGVHIVCGMCGIVDILLESLVLSGSVDRSANCWLMT
jgi:hypothetical protein